MSQIWFKTAPVKIDFSKVDKDAGIIYDVVMAQAGPAKGHGVHLEASFITDLVDYDNKHHQKTGIKARFGHPSLSDTTMGTQLGYFKNFRSAEGKALADLHLLESAEISPTQPGMRSWMLSMAEEASDFVMSSIVFTPSDYYQYNPEDGEPHYFGHPSDAKWPEEKIFVNFNILQGAQHFYTDIVEAGAATEALYGLKFNKDKFAVRLIEWLRENPDILTFIQSHPLKILEMCEKLNINLNMDTTHEKKPQSLKEKVLALFSSEEATTAIDQTEELAADVVPVEEPTDEVSADTPAEDPQAQIDYAEQITQLSGLITQLTDQVTQLTEQNATLLQRIEELEETPAATPAAVVEKDADSKTARYMCPTTKAAMGL
jgi:hypothetical protein